MQKYIQYTRNIMEWESPGAIWNSVQALSLFRKIRGYSMLSTERRIALYRLAREVEKRGVPGDVVECGVWNGGSAAILAFAIRHSASGRLLWLFDSFQGLPAPSPEDGQAAREQFRADWCRGDPTCVAAALQKSGLGGERVRVVPGWFQEVFPRIQIDRIALLHIDADWYESVKLCLEKFYGAVTPGGYIVLDDYGHWEGCRRAAEEFLETRGLRVDVRSVDATGRYFQKP
jgi:hypothetical protein